MVTLNWIPYQEPRHYPRDHGYGRSARLLLISGLCFRLLRGEQCWTSRIVIQLKPRTGQVDTSGRHSRSKLLGSEFWSALLQSEYFAGVSFKRVNISGILLNGVWCHLVWDFYCSEMLVWNRLDGTVRATKVRKWRLIRGAKGPVHTVPVCIYIYTHICTQVYTYIPIYIHTVFI